MSTRFVLRAGVGSDDLISMEMVVAPAGDVILMSRARLASPTCSTSPAPRGQPSSRCTIGAGGGTIARVDAAVLSFGPRGAGAYRPACYGLGSPRPTITERSLCSSAKAETYAGGRVRIDPARVERSTGPWRGLGST